MTKVRSSTAATIAMVALVVAASLSFFVDVQVDGFVAVHQAPLVTASAKAIGRFLSWAWLMAGAAIALVICWRTGQRHWVELLCVAMISATLAGLSADFLRGLTGRTRPYVKERPQGFYGLRAGSEWLVTKHAYNSFPSGHVATVIGFAAPLLLAGRRLGVVLLVVAAVVAGARIYVGAHHLSDVFAGALVGSLIAALVWRRYGRWQQQRNLR